MKIQIHSGRLLDVQEPKLVDIDIDDIIIGLSRTFRFGGHTHFPWSVLNHSICCWYVAKAHKQSDQIARGALLHDAAEAYLGDLSSPIKRQCPAYQVAENNLLDTIYRVYDAEDDPIISIIDQQALRWEAANFLPGGPTNNWHEKIEPIAEILRDYTKAVNLVMTTSPAELALLFRKEVLNEDYNNQRPQLH